MQLLLLMQFCPSQRFPLLVLSPLYNLLHPFSVYLSFTFTTFLPCLFFHMVLFNFNINSLEGLGDPEDNFGSSRNVDKFAIYIRLAL